MMINHNLWHQVGTPRHFHTWCMVTHTTKYHVCEATYTPWQ